MKIAVVGAGPSGIGVAKCLLANKNFDIVIFERTNAIGGLWNHNENKRKDKSNVYTGPLYKNMKTNLPKQVMCYPDFPFPKDIPTFPYYSAVKEYIMNFAKTFNILDKVRYETEVLHVAPIVNQEIISERFVKWKVQSKKTDCDNICTEDFDAVVLCSGIFSKPVMSTIKGIDNFKGETLHSKYYNAAEDYIDKVVMIHGYGPSAADIVVQLVEKCSMVYISRRTENKFFGGSHPQNVEVVANIKRIDDDGNIILENERRIFADVLLFCTGYQYDYPYLSPQCKINITDNGKVVMPLYKHSFNINYPSMAFVTVTRGGPVFSLVHHQSEYIRGVLSGEIILPSAEDMLKETVEDINQLNENVRKSYHGIGLSKFDYIDQLVSITGAEENPEIIKKIYLSNFQERLVDMYNYKNNEYQVSSAGNFHLIKAKK